MSPITTTALFQSVGIFSGFLLPIAVLLLFVILVLPGIGRSGARPESLALAAYGYLAEALGIILMTAGGLPAVYAVVSHQILASNTYLGLLVLFIVGGITYLWHDNILQSVDSESKAIPSALFFYSWKFIGLVVVLFTTLSLVLQWLTNAADKNADIWNVHLVMLLYGFLLCWFTVYPMATAQKKVIRPASRPTFPPRKTLTVAAKTTKKVAKKTK